MGLSYWSLNEPLKAIGYVYYAYNDSILYVRWYYMKKIFITLLVLFALTGCLGITNEKKTGKEFKDDYEEINNQKNKSGKIHREVTLSEYNRFVEVKPEKRPSSEETLKFELPFLSQHLDLSSIFCFSLAQ